MIGITSPTLYDPFAAIEVTFDTVGSVLSTTMALLAPKEFAAPGLASTSVAAFPAISLIEPALVGIMARPAISLPT